MFTIKISQALRLFFYANVVCGGGLFICGEFVIKVYVTGKIRL